MTDKIIRVFQRRTAATPDDEMVRVGRGPGWFDEADTVNVSVTFSWDIPLAERLAVEWERVAPVTRPGLPAVEWRNFQRQWARPAMISSHRQLTA